MLSYITAIILGVVEGFTEFLPISSTGHLILVNQFITFDKNFTLLFDVVIQLGAILAVVFFFCVPTGHLPKGEKRLWQDKSLWLKTLVGVLPAIIVGALFASKIEEKLFNPWTVAIALLIGGIIILIVEKLNHNAKITSIKDLSYKTAFFIGLIQCLSMIPGTSRSGATIIGALLLGTSRLVATEFSFFLAIPTMIAATGYSLLKYHALLNPSQLSVLIIGLIVSFFR